MTRTYFFCDRFSWEDATHISIQFRRKPTTDQRNDCTNVQLDEPVTFFIGVTNKKLGERLLIMNRGITKAAAPTEVPTPET